MLRFAGMTLAFNRTNGDIRKVRRFSDDVEQKTYECLSMLRDRTTGEKLLAAAGGNRWLARRAVALYVRDLEVEGYRNLTANIGGVTVNWVGSMLDLPAIAAQTGLAVGTIETTFRDGNKSYGVYGSF